MSRNIYLPLMLASLAAVCTSNLQDWSYNREEGEGVFIPCTPTHPDREPQVYANSTRTWHRLGDAAAIVDGQEVTPGVKDGIYWLSSNNDSLSIIPVTPKAHGIYLCKVQGLTEGTIVKGVNVNGVKKSGMDKYRDNVVTGVITGALVCLIVCSGCLLDHFRYRSPEEKENLHNLKQQRQARHARLQQSAADNPALESDVPAVESKPVEEDTHL